MKQTRTCTPSACGDEEQFVSHTSCNADSGDEDKDGGISWIPIVLIGVAVLIGIKMIGRSS